MMSALHLVWLCAALSAQPTTGPGASLGSALSALQRGDFQSAERYLRAQLAAHPEDPAVLSFLGVALDNLKRIDEAAPFHRRAVAISPRSTSVLDNYAAHLWMAGHPEEAAQVYRQVVSLDSAHYNANMQLARLALGKGNGAAALGCLDHLAPNQRDTQGSCCSACRRCTSAATWPPATVCPSVWPTWPGPI